MDTWFEDSEILYRLLELQRKLVEGCKPWCHRVGLEAASVKTKNGRDIGDRQEYSCSDSRGLSRQRRPDCFALKASPCRLSYLAYRDALVHCGTSARSNDARLQQITRPTTVMTNQPRAQPGRPSLVPQSYSTGSSHQIRASMPTTRS